MSAEIGTEARLIDFGSPHSTLSYSKGPKIINDYDDQFPVTNNVCKHHICLPLYPGLTNQEVQYIVESLKNVLNIKSKKIIQWKLQGINS